MIKQMKSGTKVKAQLHDLRGPYWSIGRITQVLPADALRPQASYVFQGFDRGGFPIEIGLAIEQVEEIN